MGALPPFTSVCFLLSSGSRGPRLTLGTENHRVQALLGASGCFWVLGASAQVARWPVGSCGSARTRNMFLVLARPALLPLMAQGLVTRPSAHAVAQWFIGSMFRWFNGTVGSCHGDGVARVVLSDRQHGVFPHVQSESLGIMDTRWVRSQPKHKKPSTKLWLSGSVLALWSQSGPSLVRILWAAPLTP